MQIKTSNITADGRFLLIDCGSRFIAGNAADKIKPGTQYLCDIKQKRERRSNDANAYFWVMCGTLAARLRIPKEEIYRSMIKEIGDNFFIAPIESAKSAQVCKAWNDKGLGWVTDNLGDSKLKGYVNICFYFGSSTYDTEQMSRLIDLLITECREQGIDTLNDRERSLMLEAWNAKTNKSDSH